MGVDVVVFLLRLCGMLFGDDVFDVLDVLLMGERLCVSLVKSVVILGLFMVCFCVCDVYCGEARERSGRRRFRASRYVTFLF